MSESEGCENKQECGPQGESPGEDNHGSRGGACSSGGEGAPTSGMRLDAQTQSTLVKPSCHPGTHLLNSGGCAGMSKVPGQKTPRWVEHRWLR